MLSRASLVLLILFGLAASGGPAAAQEASAELRQRAEQVAALPRGEVDAEETFAPAFLAVVPEARIEAVTRQLVSEHGQGFQGGSEAGVINLTFLVQDRAGRWHALASCNDRVAPADNDRFASLMARASRLLP